MTSPAPDQKNWTKLYIVKHSFEQLLLKQAIPNSAILLEAVRPLEERLCERGLVSGRSRSELLPLWFLAENERNVFLWRHGLSLNDISEFEFWIDLPALAEKRASRLGSLSSDDPFNCNSWGITEQPSPTPQEEQSYLNSICEQFTKIALHIHTLSQVTKELKNELLLNRGERLPTPVVLPAKAGTTSNLMTAAKPSTDLVSN